MSDGLNVTIKEMLPGVDGDGQQWAMERTELQKSPTGYIRELRRAIPFEGNGNAGAQLCAIPRAKLSCAIPFEGNGNWVLLEDIWGGCGVSV